MRTLGTSLRWLCWLALVIAAVAWGLSTWKRLSKLTDSEEGERPLVFFVPGEQSPPRFNVTGHAGWALLYPAVVVDPGAAPPSYGLRLRVRAANGDVLSEEMRHVGHAADFARAAPHGRTAERPSQPIRWSSAQWVDLARHPQAATVEAVVLAATPGGPPAKVFWRGFLLRSLDDAAARARYRELSRSEREALTGDFLTPSGLLPESVRLELTRRHLEPAPVSGTSPGQYREITLYMRRKAARPTPPKPAAVLPGGWPIGPGLPVTLALDTATDVDLVAIDRDGRPMPVRMHRWEDGQAHTMTWEAVADPAMPSRTMLPAGVYAFDSARVGLLRLRATTDGRPLLPDALRIATFAVSPQQPLEYRIHPIDGRPVRLRVDVRPLNVGPLNVRPLGAPANIRLRALDSVSGSLLEQTLTLTPQRAQYERHARAPDTAATLATRRILNVPGSTRRLRIDSDAPVLATVYAEGDRRDAGAARWFSFYPANRERHASHDILRQPRWPPRPPSAGTGDADLPGPHSPSPNLNYVALQPTGLARSQLALMPDRLAPGAEALPPGLPDRLRSLTTTRAVELQVVEGRPPALAWLRRDEAPATARLQVDGIAIDVAIVGRTGLTDLPPLPPGRHRLQLLDGKGARWMISRAGGGDWRLRRLWTLTPNAPLRFALPRERARGIVNVLAFAPAGHPAPALSAVFDTASGAQRVVARRRDAAQTSQEAWPLWSTAGPWLGPQRWSIDVPDAAAQGGSLRFALHCENCRDVNVLVFRMSPAPEMRTIRANVASRLSVFADDDGAIESEVRDVH